GQTELLGTNTIDIEVKRRIIIQLLHMDIDCTGNVTHAVGDLLSYGVVAGIVGTGELDIDGSRSSEVENLGNDVSRLEEELDARKLSRQFATKLADVLFGRLVLFVESHEDLGIGGADGAGVAVGQIDSAVGQTDVVENRLCFALRNVAPDFLFDLIDQARGL